MGTKTPKLLGAVAALAMAAALPTGTALADIVELKLADRLPQDHYIARYATDYWIAEVEKATGGAVDIKRYPSQQLGKSKDMLTLTKAGVVDMGEYVPGYLGDQMPLSSVAEIPGMVPSACAASRAYEELAKPGGLLGENELKPLGIRLLYVVGLPPYQLFTSKDLKGVDSLAGLKIRSTGAAMDAGLRELGIVPIRMSAAELTESYSRGTVDGTAFPAASIYSYDLQKQTRNATEGLSFGSSMTFYGISEKVWDKLSPDVQAAMIEAGRKTTERACALIDKDDRAALERLQADGVTLVAFDAANRALFAEKLAPVAEAWAKGEDGKGRQGSETLAAFRAAIAKQQ
ncbi:MAG: TRAP transporter substrate-binding protein DctP [Sneathiellaceae bacterium]